MSISDIQAQAILEDIARNYYASGVTPTIDQVLGKMSEYFAQFPPGLPLPFPSDFAVSKLTANVDDFNQVLARTIMNMEVLYEACVDHITESMQLVSTLVARLGRLETQRNHIITTVDDYLLSNSNAAGYFLSVSDSFTDVSKTDLSLTSAHVDTSIQAVILPTLGALTKRIDSTLVGVPDMNITVNNNAFNNFITTGGFINAFDGLDNTFWGFTVAVSAPATVTVQVLISLGNQNNVVEISRFDFNPYGISPVQMFAEVQTPDQAGGTTGGFQTFGNKIQTSDQTMTLIDNPIVATAFRITLTKKDYDYIDSSSGTPSYIFQFGAKEIVWTQHVFDNAATFVSAPISMPADLQHEAFIDAVSVDANADIPNNTSIVYYVAEDSGEVNLGDFPWQRIDPIGTVNSKRTVANFNGTQTNSIYIRSAPSLGDTQLILPDTTNLNFALRNPSPSIIPGTDVWRLFPFTDMSVPTQSMSLDEGINTTRIYYTDRQPALIVDDQLKLWAAYIQSLSGNAVQAPPNTDSIGVITVPPSVTYGRIDAGNNFFYGGDIGQSNQSVFVETYLDSSDDQQLFLADVQKADPNSLGWDVRVFLNGANIGYLPANTPSLTVPWLFRRGLNHICLSINIPDGIPALPSPYLGTIKLLGDKNLYSYGQVKLAHWDYVSMFEMQYNQINQPATFTIYNGEVISRRQPTDNFLFTYTKPTSIGPDNLRFRADLARATNNINISPKLNSYQIRFAYGAGLNRP